MALDPRQRRELIARGQHLQPIVTVTAANLSDGAIEHVRACLAAHELAHVRIRARTKEECEAAVAELVARVPCQRVTRVGRVVLLYRPAEAPGGPPA